MDRLRPLGQLPRGTNQIASPWHQESATPVAPDLVTLSRPASKEAIAPTCEEPPSRLHRLHGILMMGVSMFGTWMGGVQSAMAQSISTSIVQIHVPSNEGDGKQDVDGRTERTDSFLRQWMRDAFDPRLTDGQRLDEALRRDPLSARSFSQIQGDASRAPSLGTLGHISSFDDLRTRVDGQLPAGADFNRTALDMGARFGSRNYAYGAGGSVPADVSAFDLYNKQKGVCVEIHAAVAAYRRAHGQEAYVVGSSAVGSSHAFLIFKDHGKWYVQNYGTVVGTNARNLRELFDRAMPEEVRPTLYEPQADGSMKRVGGDFVTNGGMADRRFTDHAGTGDFDPFS